MLEIEQTNLENIKKLYYKSTLKKTLVYETYNFIYQVNTQYLLPENAAIVTPIHIPIQIPKQGRKV